MLKLHEVHSGTILNLRIGWLRLQVTVQDKWVIFFSTSLQCSKVPQVAPSLKHTDVTFHMYVKKAKIKNQDHLVVADCYCYKPAAFVDSLEGCSCEGLQFKVSTSASSKVLGSEGCGRFLPVRLFFLFFHYCALRHILPCVSVCEAKCESISGPRTGCVKRRQHLSTLLSRVCVPGLPRDADAAAPRGRWTADTEAGEK